MLRFLCGLWGHVALSVLLGTLAVGASVSLMGTSAWLISAAALPPSLAEPQVTIVGVRFFGISRADFRHLERLALPIAVNQAAERVHILDMEGRPLLSLQNYSPTESHTDWTAQPFVARVLRRESSERGDKFAGLVQSAEEEAF